MRQPLKSQTERTRRSPDRSVVRSGPLTHLCAALSLYRACLINVLSVPYFCTGRSLERDADVGRIREGFRNSSESGPPTRITQGGGLQSGVLGETVRPRGNEAARTRKGHGGPRTGRRAGAR